MENIAIRLREGMGAIRSYFRDVVVETRKVKWPTRKELIEYTVTVIVVCIVVFLLTYAFDVLVTEGFKLVGIGS